MKSLSLVIATTLLLAGCAHQASYDSLGGYDSSSTSYSIGVSSGYPAYGYGYAPAYRPYYVPYGGHRHYHDGHHHRHDRDRDGRGGRDGHDRHDDGKKGDRPGGKPRAEGRPHGGNDARPDRGGGKGGSGSRPERPRGDRGDRGR